MRAMVIGGGGREHALAWGLANSPSVDEVHVAPGNAGTEALGPQHAIDAEDPSAVADLAAGIGADLVVVGPEAPLVAGVADELRSRGIATFGPSRAAAEVEGSKAFSKELMVAAGVDTAGYGAFTDPDEAKAALEGYAAPYVVKADGLAAGKGVRICATIDEAREAIDTSMVERAFGDAGAMVVVEEFLHGPEASVFGICDGTDVVVLAPSQDFKRALDGDEGLNTGGMGAYTPIPHLTADQAAGLADTVFRPVLRELAARGTPYSGLLYAGLVLTDAGPRVLEFNCRFGDPETQVVVPRIASDFGELLLASATGSLADVDVRYHDDAFVTVVLASGGYPGSYEKGKPISGVADAEALDGVWVFHAGTARDGGGQLVTNGGRVMNVTARGATIADARARAYAAADLISWEGQHRREDIALAASTLATGTD